MALATLAGLSEADRKRVMGWLEEFDNNWHEKRLAAQVRELPRQGPVRAAALAEMVKIDLVNQWQKGRHARLEVYLKALPELGTTDTVAVDLIVAEFRARQAAQQPAKVEDFAARFPQQAGELRALLQDDDRGSIGAAQQETRKTGADMPRHSTGPVSLPEQFGRYRIIKELGKGGMGAVYLAHDLQLDRKVAVKIPHFTPEDGPRTRERFFREAKAAAHLDHPNVCPVYDVGEINGIHYLTMAYIEGKPLSDLIQKGKPLPQRGVAALVRKLALAMEQAHAAGVIHRDLKPANIMINKRREPVIMDFGLARRMDKDARVTRSGQVLGTPAYMPPEQVMGDVDAMGPGSDVYSLGVILYELLTGQRPFSGGVGQVMAKVVTEPPEPPSTIRPDLEPALEAICLKAMAKETDQRYESMAAMAAALSRYLKVDVAEARPVKKAPGKAAPAAKAPSEAEKLVAQLVDQLVSRIEPAESRAATARRFSRWTLVAGAVFLLGIAVVAVVLVRNANVKVENTVVVKLQDIKELSDPTIVVFILDGKEISREELAKPIKLGVGKHELVAKRADGTVVSRRAINIRDDKTIEVASAVPEKGVDTNDGKDPPIKDPKDDVKDGKAGPIKDPKNDVKPGEQWQPVFNSKDLSGWSTWPTGTTGWVAKDGILEGSGPLTHLFSPHGSHQNFRIRFEAMINDGGVGGIYFRAKFAPGKPYGYLGVINSTANYGYGKTGSVYHAGPFSYQLGQRVEKTPIRADTWFTGEVIANGNHIQYLVNGEKVLDEVDVQKSYSEGFFALHRETQATNIKLRKFEVEELPPGRPVVQPGAEGGWVQLFNRKDLSGWKAFTKGTAGWRVNDGILIGSGPVNTLFTQRGDYENFHFRVECKINDQGDAGQFFRTQFAPDVPYGYVVKINSTANGDKMGTLYRVGGSSYHPGEAPRQAYAMIKPDTWFVQEVIADGNHLVVKVDGKTIADIVHQKDFYTKGHLALHKYNPRTIVQFRTIEIKELPGAQ